MRTAPIEISVHYVTQTIRLLRASNDRECVLLWLAHREHDIQRVQEVFHPMQQASSDYFHIPRQGMARLMEHLRTSGLYIAGQVHTHPSEAFHSHADDTWAIVRHVGAISIVTPEFAR